MDVIKQLCEAQNLDELEGIFFKSLKKIGITNYAYVLKDCPEWRNSEPFYITNYSKNWTDHYFDSEYQKIDPVLLSLDYSKKPFRWGDISKQKELNKSQKDFFFEANEFGLTSGLSIPVLSPSMGEAVVALVSDLPEKETNKVFEDELYKVSLYSVYFHHAALHLSGRLLMRRKENDNYKLTDRERDIIYWAAENKTYPEIAIILGISYNTVLFHAKNIYQKMNVYSRQEMVVKAIVSGIVAAN